MSNILKVITLIILFNVNFVFPDETISIGITPPFIKNENASTMFYYKHFSFELIFNYNDNKYLLEIINTDIYENEDDYINMCKNNVLEQNYDYLLYSSVYSNEDYLFFKVELLNPYTNTIIFSRIFKQKIDYSINEVLPDISKNIIELINNSKLVNISGKKKEETKEKVNKIQYNEFFIRSKHEIFIMQGFFKNHPGIISFIEVLSGYNFSPNKFTSIEGGVFLGCGYQDELYIFKNIKFNKFFIGTYGAFYIFISGFIEPSVGLRLDFIYISPNNVYLSFPIDFGLKINFSNKYCIRFDASFQFIAYDFNSFSWKNNFIIGFLIGYAQKI